MHDPIVIEKARRRIKRFITTGDVQARVYETDDPKMFEYKLVHHVKSIFFKRDVLGRLRVVK